MFWELRSVIDGIKGEYQGWHEFRRATGDWPVLTVLVSIFSVPLFFLSVLYFLINALETGRLRFIYLTLFAVVCGSAALLYGLRRLACKIDVARARKRHRTLTSSEALENLIR
jgi:hypothetical protein